jgi:ubiquinone/menaquinone biosynthesis C-methylase UbiE
MNPKDLSVQRFTGFAEVYDRYRPGPPAAMAEILCRLAQRSLPDLVVDLGCGTGLSTRFWSGKARQVIGIDPTPDMLEQARRIATGPEVSYRQGFSHATGLPDQSTDIVTCSQALHWMEPGPTFQEVRRILRPGGVFAAFDFDWPPHTLSWQVSQAYEACMRRVSEAEKGKEVARQWPKSGHLQRMVESGCFRYTTEMVIHSNEAGNAERIVGVLLSQGSVAGLLRKDYSEQDLGIDRLRQVAQRELGDDPQTWYFSSRVRLGVV